MSAQRLSKRKEREAIYRCAGRHFKLDVKNRFLMLLVYYRLYITYTLAGFLFDLDQSSICRDIQKIEPLVRKCVPIPQKIYNRITKRLQNTARSRKMLSRIYGFHRLHRTADTKAQEQNKQEKHIFQARKRNIL